MSTQQTKKIEEKCKDLRDLSSFAATSLADDDGGGVGFDEIEKGVAAIVHWQPLALLLDVSVPKARRRGRNRRR